MVTWYNPSPTPTSLKAGLRFGERGTHTSRTMMLTELRELLHALPPNKERAAYDSAILEDNILGKVTEATRRLTAQRLSELYGLDPGLPLFRALRRVWEADEVGRPLIALLCALARDPLLRYTAQPVLSLSEGAELSRTSFLSAIRAATGDRLNDSTLDKVARNAASSWSQSGHLVGRVRKIRRHVSPTPGALALALWLGSLEGLAGEQLLSSRWASVLDRSPSGLVPVALRAKQLGLISASIGGGTTEIDATELDAVQHMN